MSAKILKGPNLKYTPTSTLGQVFFNCAQKHHDKICHTDSNTDEHETFFSIKQRSTRVALSMLKHGVTSEHVIVTCSFVNLDTPVPILAAFFLGAKVANLDPTLSVRHTSHLLSIVSPRMVFVEESSVALIEESLQLAKLKTEIVVFGKSAKYISFSTFLVEQPGENVFLPIAEDLRDTAIMFFSSGTTGLPKVICHSHQSFLSLAFSFIESGGRFDSVLTFTSFYWISGMLYFTGSFAAGGRRIVCGGNWAPEQLFSCIEKYKITYMFLAPVILSQLLASPNYHNYDTSSLFSLLITGTPKTDLIFAYGLTEVGVATMLPTDKNNLSEIKIVSSGKPISGYTIKIVDTETRKILEPHQKGEICIKPLSAMNGYYKTDSSDIFDKDGFLKTGDIGFYDEKECIFVVDRIKEMFKYLSWHIVPSALEVVLLEHPNVKEAVVFGLPRSEEEGEVPTACVVLKDGGIVTEQEVQDFLAARVSDRERLRGGVYFLKELYRTPSGKLKRNEIKNYVIELIKNKI